MGEREELITWLDIQIIRKRAIGLPDCLNLAKKYERLRRLIYADGQRTPPTESPEGEEP